GGPPAATPGLAPRRGRPCPSRPGSSPCARDGASPPGGTWTGPYMDVPGKGTMGQTWTMADQPDGRPSAEDRLSDAERERAVELLQKHTGDGRPTLDELSERVGVVYARLS